MRVHKYIYFFILLNCILHPQSIIINEVYNSSGNDEWIELLVVQDSLDIRNWDIRDFNSSGVAQLPLEFTNNSLWGNLRQGTIIIVGRPENTFSEDLDPSDYLMIVKSSNALYFSGNVFLFAGSSEAVQIRNATDTNIFGVSWGASNASSLPSPKVHFIDPSLSNVSTFFNGDDVSQLTTTTNWTQNGTSSLGIGNTTTNINWIESLRAGVPSSVTITFPNGGENWQVGSSQNITWTSSNVVSLKLEYSTNNGTNWTQIIASTPASTGIYSWTVPNTPSTQCKLRLTDTNNSAIGDTSNKLFAISSIPINPCPGTPTVLYEGKTYNTVMIGDQCWLKENLDIGTIIPGTQNQNNNGLIEKYCYDNDPNNCNIYGGLYQWNEAMQYVLTEPAQGICPEGWHLPTLAEYQTLAMTVNDDGNTLKEIGQGSGGGAGTNTSGFSILLSGHRFTNGNYVDLGDYNYLWSSKEDNTENAVFLFLKSTDNFVSWSNDDKELGFSVRCIRDALVESINLNLPNGGENWIVGTSYNINWSSTNIVNAKLEYTTDDGVSWMEIISSTPASTGSYSWTVPNTPSTQCKVRISDASNASLNDLSNNFFAISSIPINPCPGTPTVDYQGRTYNTVLIGDQCWLRENLDLGTMIPGAQSQINNSIIEKYCYDDDPDNCDIYGGMYQWNEAMQYVTTTGAQGICPTGWHLPTLSEFQTLSTTVTNDGNALKEIGQGTGDGAGTNTSGFSALLAGYKQASGSFGNLGGNAFFWSSTMSDAFDAEDLILISSNSSISLDHGSKDYGFSIRCVRDELIESLNLNSPNGGEIWQVGTSNNITWTSTNVATVKLEYTTNDGTIWIDIVASTSASSGSYSWIIPNTTSTQCKVRISDASNFLINDISEGFFEISDRTPFWQHFGLGGSSINALTVSLTNDIYAGDNTNGLWRYNSSGWNLVNTAGGGTQPDRVNALTVNPQGEIFAAYEDRVWYSTDNGANWTTRGSSVYNTISVMVSNSPGVIFAGHGGGLERSSDYGWSWQSIHYGLNAGAFALTFDSQNRIYAGTEAGSIYRSTNNGDTWVLFPNIPQGLGLIQSILLYNNSIYVATDLAGVIKSTDDGQTWVVISNGLTGNALKVNALVAEGSTIYASTSGGTFFSTDLGETWVENSYGLDAGFPPVEMIEDNDGYLYAGTWNSGGVYRSIQPVDSSIALLTPNGGEILTVGETDTIRWNTSIDGNVKIEFSTDFGQTWSFLITDLPANQNEYLWTIPDAPTMLGLIKITSLSYPSIIDSSYLGFTITYPPIGTWTPVLSDFEGTFKDIHFVNQDMGWAVGHPSGAILKTTNGGSTWSEQTSAVSYELQSVFFINENDGWTIGFNNPLKTTNSGLTWFEQSLGASRPLFSIHFVDSLYGWIAGDNGSIYNTTDGGTTWNSQSSGVSTRLYSILFINRNIGWAVGDNSILKTTDGGTNWTINNNHPYGVFQSVYFINSNIGWIVGGSQRNILKTTDGGNNWFAQSSNWTGALNSVYFTDESKGWAAGDGSTILMTTNGGSTWFRQITNATSSLYSCNFINPNLGFACGVGQILKYTNQTPIQTLVLNSPNGGEDWQIDSTQNITWTSSGITNVKLEYTTNNGTNWIEIIASTPAIAGSYSWTVPNTPSTQCKIRVSDATNSFVNDISAATFTISTPVAAIITVTSPVEGDTWIVGSEQVITWSSTNVTGYLNIWLSLDGGSTYLIPLSLVTENDRIDTVTVPITQSANCRIKIESIDNLSVYGLNTGNFLIREAVPIINVNPTSLAFGEVVLNDSLTKNITINNVGEINLNISDIFASNSVFSVSPSSFTVSPGDSEVVLVKFSPTDAITYSEKLIVSSNTGSGSDTISLSGDGIYASVAIINLSTTSLDFGSVKTSSTIQRIFTVSNDASATINLDVTDILASNNVYAVSPTNFSISPGNAQDVTVTFSPAAEISYNETLTINHNAAGNQSSISLIGSGFVYPATITLNNTVNFGSTANIANYKIIGLSGQTSSPVTSGLTGEHPYDWNVYWDNGEADNYQLQYDGTSNFNFAPGKAFWILSKNPFIVSTQVNSVELATDYSYSIPLHPGWNLISNPFEKSAIWSEVQSVNGLSQNQILYSWNGIWSNPSELKPYQGYYFNNTANLTSLKIPYNPNGSLGKSTLAKGDITKSLPIDVSDMLTLQINESEIFVGINPESKEGFDEYDYFSPPSDFENTRLSLIRQELSKRDRNLFIEQRPEIGDGQEFELEIKAIENEILKLRTAGIVNFADYEIYLLDKRLSNLYNLKVKQEIELVFAHHINEMKLYIGTQEYIDELKSKLTPLEYGLEQNYPNPFNPATVFRFAVPENGKVKLQIYNVLGELVQTVINDIEYNSGKYEVKFDGSGLSSGVYIYRLQAGSFVSSKKMMLVK